MWFLYLDWMSGSDPLIVDSLYLLSNISQPLISAAYTLMSLCDGVEMAPEKQMNLSAESLVIS